MQLLSALVWVLWGSDLAPRGNCAFPISLVMDAGAAQAAACVQP